MSLGVTYCLMEQGGLMAEPFFFLAEWISVGCKMVPNNEWYQAPLDVPIFGLKELEESV